MPSLSLPTLTNSKLQKSTSDYSVASSVSKVSCHEIEEQKTRFSNRESSESSSSANNSETEEMANKKLLDISNYKTFDIFVKNYKRWRKLSPATTEDSDDDVNYFLLTIAQHEKWGKSADRIAEANPTHKVTALIKALKSELDPTQIEAHALLCELFKSSQGSDTMEGLKEYYEYVDGVRTLTEMSTIPEKVFTSCFASNCKYSAEIITKIDKDTKLYDAFLLARKAAVAAQASSGSICRVQSSTRREKCGFCGGDNHPEEKCFKKKRHIRNKQRKDNRKGGFKKGKSDKSGEYMQIKSMISDLAARLEKMDGSSESDENVQVQKKRLYSKKVYLQPGGPESKNTRYSWVTTPDSGATNTTISLKTCVSKGFKIDKSFIPKLTGFDGYRSNKAVGTTDFWVRVHTGRFAKAVLITAAVIDAEPEIVDL